MFWFLLFNCMPVDNKIYSTNMLTAKDTVYRTEESCLKDAKIGSKKAEDIQACYFVCVKGYGSV